MAEACIERRLAAILAVDNRRELIDPKIAEHRAAILPTAVSA
jgi:hypothetical protein